MSVIASLSSGSVWKGLAAGAMGLWISTVGYDDIQGVERFNFTSHLDGGVNIVAALVGLFAIPQVIDMLARSPGAGAAVASLRAHPLARAARQTFAKTRALAIGSICGIVVGLIPGAGGQIAGLVAYDQARKFSKNPKRFGAGGSEGIIAAETANNAMVGPSLAPLLTLSVPGSPTAAVLLGGLLIHGIFPGPNLFSDYPEVAWTFIDALLVGQILMVVFGLWMCGFAARVMLLPENYLAAGVLTLAVFGTYSVQHSVSDVLVMASLGGGMWLLQKYGFSSGPLVLGIVLGPLAESNFVQGKIIAEAGDGVWPYFFGGALNVILILIVAASVAASVALEIRARKKAAQ